MWGFYKHTYLDKDGRRKPAHLLIECREFIQLIQALQEKMRVKAATLPAVPGAITHGAPPPSLLPNMQQQGHQTVIIQHRLKPW
jgi:hypothetical protein